VPSRDRQIRRRYACLHIYFDVFLLVLESDHSVDMNGARQRLRGPILKPSAAGRKQAAQEDYEGGQDCHR